MQLLSRSRAVRAALDAYVNSGATPAISETYVRIKAVRDGSGTDMGGARETETVTIVSDTGDADIAADLDGLLDQYVTTTAVYPEDASGNGGGGKLGY
jgi:hypothetical protein